MSETAQRFNSTLKKKIEESSRFIRNQFQVNPSLAIIFGSALADEFLSKVKIEKTLPFEQIPHFRKSTVPGHRGSLHLAYLKKLPILISEGRTHYYEGYPIEEVGFPVRVYSELGTKELILTNAAGGLNPRFRLGDLVLISDHLNLSGVNPLHGFQAQEFGSRFVSLTNAYDPSILKKMKKTALSEKIKTGEGVYVWIAGPSYETEAEVKMFRKLGGDLIGMSTVPEVIVAKQVGLKVAAISCVTNLLGSSKRKDLSHEEVMSQAKKGQKQLAKLLERYLMNDTDNI